MTPRRRAWLLVAVLGVAGVGFVISYRPLWLAVAYENVGIRDLEVRQRRWSWMPVPTHVIPPQRCGACNAGSHPNCGILFPMDSDGAFEFWRMMQEFEESDDWPMAVHDFRCTCTHPSHQDE